MTGMWFHFESDQHLCCDNINRNCSVINYSYSPFQRNSGYNFPLFPLCQKTKGAFFNFFFSKRRFKNILTCLMNLWPRYWNQFMKKVSSLTEFNIPPYSIPVHYHAPLPVLNSKQVLMSWTNLHSLGKRTE